MGTQCWLHAWWVSTWFSTEAEIVLFAAPFRPAVGPTQPSIQIVRNVFPWAWSSHVLKLTTNLHLLPRLKMLGAVPHLPILVYGVVLNFSTGTALPFPDQWLTFVSPAINAIATVKTDISWRSDWLDILQHMNRMLVNFVSLLYRSAHYSAAQCGLLDGWLVSPWRGVESCQTRPALEMMHRSRKRWRYR